MTRKHQVSLTLDKQLLEIVDSRGGNRSETINRDLFDYYLILRDFAPLTKEESCANES